MRIKDPLIELLAIKLYEHDFHGKWPPAPVPNWARLAEEDRELYREIARGNQSFGLGVNRG